MLRTYFQSIEKIKSKSKGIMSIEMKPPWRISSFIFDCLFELDDELSVKWINHSIGHFHAKPTTSRTLKTEMLHSSSLIVTLSFTPMWSAKDWKIRCVLGVCSVGFSGRKATIGFHWVDRGFDVSSAPWNWSQRFCGLGDRKIWMNAN